MRSVFPITRQLRFRFPLRRQVHTGSTIAMLWAQLPAYHCAESILDVERNFV